jgi:hypothetical protein
MEFENKVILNIIDKSNISVIGCMEDFFKVKLELKKFLKAEKSRSISISKHLIKHFLRLKEMILKKSGAFEIFVDYIKSEVHV